MKNGSSAIAHETACSRVAANFRERWLRTYVGKKLRTDPIFPAAFELLRASRQPLVDIGCGVGLLAFYLRERDFVEPITGFDRDSRKISRARVVAERAYPELSFIEQDIREPIAALGNVVVFDLLHYLSPNEQMALLERFAARVAPDGMLIVRDSPREGNVRFWLTYLAERFAQATTWNMNVELHFPTRDKICAPFDEQDFSWSIRPLWGRTPFNNHLFIFRRRAPAVVLNEAECSDSSLSLGR
jgi:2-polyprenyl-3-methyl-5-hydroxy-6-metoxy-1,4-benzoquinol methylase